MINFPKSDQKNVRMSGQLVYYFEESAERAANREQSFVVAAKPIIVFTVRREIVRGNDGVAVPIERS